MSVSRSTGLRNERVVASRQYAGGGFQNTQPVALGLKRGETLAAMGEYFFGGARRTPPGPLPSLDPRAGWARPVDTGLRATWLGHSTVLLEIDGRRVLTDPVWGERASPVSFVGPRRFQPVPIALDALPPLDAVIVSHDHYDHLDRQSIIALARRGVPIITTLGVGGHLEAWGIPPEQVTELDWWERHEIGDLVLTAVPSQHFSGRGLSRNATLWASYVVQGPRHRVFFSGDTGLTPEYADVRARLGPFDLVMLEVGAFHPAWGDIHLGPHNALAALELLGGGSFLPVHWGTFNLGMHPWDDPAETLLELAPARGVHLVMPRLGEPVEPSRVERLEPWWHTVVEGRELRRPLPASDGGPQEAIADPID